MLLDTSFKFVTTRLREILDGLPNFPTQSTNLARGDGHLDNFHHFTAPSLPHLLALLTHQFPAFPPPGTSLLVVDSVSALFALAFPKNTETINRQQTPVKKNDVAQWASGRRWAVMGDFISSIVKLAATRNIAVLIISQTTTRIRSESAAILHPAISGTAWDSGIGTRIVLFRDWMFNNSITSSSQGDLMSGVRFAGVVKAKGISYEGLGRVSPFTIQKVSPFCGCNSIANDTKDGLRDAIVDQVDITRNASPVVPATLLKRKHEEIADSQSEEEAAASDQEFGWAGDDPTFYTDELS